MASFLISYNPSGQSAQTNFAALQSQIGGSQTEQGQAEGGVKFKHRKELPVWNAQSNCILHWMTSISLHTECASACVWSLRVFIPGKTGLTGTFSTETYLSVFIYQLPLWLLMLVEIWMPMCLLKSKECLLKLKESVRCSSHKHPNMMSFQENIESLSHSVPGLKLGARSSRFSEDQAYISCLWYENAC